MIPSNQQVMSKEKINGMLPHQLVESYEFVEVDPTGRYGRYDEILGKGASKTVYRGFDEYEGMEIAWNQVKLNDYLQHPEDLERLYCEIHLLKTLKHKNIMKFYSSWVDIENRKINFVTEMFTSGTLKQYRLKHTRVNIRALKNWCRQILEGLVYLHNHDPPVIHRDLKCDNIFVNGNEGEVKIGDLGLAAILQKPHADHCVGTIEFMAPEIYKEEYNELVDVYSFGMCIIEMITLEYPYSECTNPAQIFNKVTSGKKPAALYKIEDVEVREFIRKCLETVSQRLSATQLLDDPFLRRHDDPYNFRRIGYWEQDDAGFHTRQPFLDLHDPVKHHANGDADIGDCDFETWYESEFHPPITEQCGMEHLQYGNEEDSSSNVGITIKGKMGNDGGVSVRIQIADKEGQIRNIFFPFDISSDTALSVAKEMVMELDISDQDVTEIANMIDREMAFLVPDWSMDHRRGKMISDENHDVCLSCASTCSSSISIA